jgi:hypothetical protein
VSGYRSSVPRYGRCSFCRCFYALRRSDGTVQGHQCGLKVRCIGSKRLPIEGSCVALPGWDAPPVDPDYVYRVDQTT